MVKICILIIYSKNDNYDRMLEIQKKYLESYNNIIFYFTQMVPGQEGELEVDNHFINIRGEESYLNILKKSVDSMKYINNNYDFDYLIRTNISTVVNINKLCEFLENAPREKYYGCCWYLTLNNLDHRCGIIDNTHFGTRYAQGTNIIFSKDIVQSICHNNDKLNNSVVDDVAFGVYVSRYFPEAYEISSKYIPTMLFTQSNDNITTDYIFYRNRRYENSPERHTSEENRDNDIQTMTYLTSIMGLFN